MEALGSTIEQQCFISGHRNKYSSYIFQIVSSLGHGYGFQRFNKNIFSEGRASDANKEPEPTALPGRAAKEGAR
jgi:hypothetical protein